MEFFRCSSTCQPTYWHECQIIMVSAHPNEFSHPYEYYKLVKSLCQCTCLFNLPKYTISQVKNVFYLHLPPLIFNQISTLCPYKPLLYKYAPFLADLFLHHTHPDFFQYNDVPAPGLAILTFYHLKHLLQRSY